MSRDSEWFKNTLEAWLVATSGSTPVVPCSRVVRERLSDLRKVLAQDLDPPTSLAPGDESLNVLSLLSSELIQVTDPSEQVLLEAEGAYRAISGWQWAADEVGELQEMLCRFAFLAWRHGRALGFVRRSHEWLERFDADLKAISVQSECFEYFLSAPARERSSALNRTFLSDSEDLFLLCSILRRRRNETPGELLQQLPTLKNWLDLEFQPSSFRDEREYYLAQLETDMGVCQRWVGHRDVALSHFSTAENLLARTTAPEAALAELELMRLTARYEMGERESLLAPIRGLRPTLRELGMGTVVAKSDVLEGALLKSMNRLDEAFEIYSRVLESDAVRGSENLRTFVLEHVADVLTLQCKFEAAKGFLAEAASSMTAKGDTTRALLTMIVGECHRFQGEFEMALQQFEQAERECGEAGLAATLAYARLNAAEILLMMGRDHEAEAKIRLALPIIQDCKMVNEGISALVLLRESLRRQRTDAVALRQLREHLGATES